MAHSCIQPARLPQPRSAAAPLSDFGRELFAGLAAAPRSISPKFFYDAAGSRAVRPHLRAARVLPDAHRAAHPHRMRAARSRRRSARTPRSSSSAPARCTKVRLLLDALRGAAALRADRHLGRAPRSGGAAPARRLPAARVQPVVADYTHAAGAARARPRARASASASSRARRSATSAPTRRWPSCSWRSGCCAAAACCSASTWSRTRRVLHAAYNDAQGVTAAFNLNLLRARQRASSAPTSTSTGFDARGLLQRAAAAHRDAPGEPPRADASRCDGERFDFDEGETHPHRELAQVHRRGPARAGREGRASGRRRCGPIPSACSACTGCSRPRHNRSARPAFGGPGDLE